MLKNKRRIISFLTAFSLTMGIINPIGVVSATTKAEKKENVVSEKKIEEKKEEKNDSSDDNVKIQFLATTDVHGKFMNYDYATTSKSSGGMNQAATIIKGEKSKNENTIVIDNGDTIQGNYNHLFLTNDYLSKKTNPMVLALNEIGYDAFALGNHEFNYGMDTLHKIVEQSKKGGTEVLCANLYKDGKRIFEPYTIKEMDGIKVAVIGVVTNHITRWDADKLVGYEPTNPAKEVQKVIRELKKNNAADVFVVSSHMGLEEEYGDGDSARSIAELNPEVSLIVAGHSHANSFVTEVNGVTIAQPKNGAQAVSKVEIEVKKNEDSVEVIGVDASNIAITNDTPEDEKLNELLKDAHEIAYNDATSPIGKLVGGNLADNNEVNGIPQSFVNDQGVTDLINEVQLYYSAKNLASLGIDASKAYHVSGAAMLSASANLYEGDITKAALANIYKFDNKLYTVKTTGKQIKKYLEWTSEFYNTFKDGDLTISFDESVPSFKYDTLSGVKYEINISKPVGQRIENLKFNDDKVVEDNDVVYLTVNDYRYSSDLAPIFDKGEHDKIYETTNDPLSDVRDMIADYIANVKGGEITKNVDNNWKLTGVKYNEKLREKVVELINDGTIQAPISYGIVKSSLTWNDVKAQLTEKGLTEKLKELQELVGKTIDVLSFNDFHGSVLESGKNIGAAKMTGVIKAYQEKQNDLYGVVPVVAGDAYQGTAISNLTKGEPVNEMIKAIGAKVSAVGNHEFDWDRSDFGTWEGQGDFEFLAANIVYKENGELVDFVKPYAIVEQNGVKIAFIGLATTDTVTSTKADKIEDLDFLDPIETMNKWSPVVREAGADVIIALSHSGATELEDGTIEGEAADIAAKSNDVDAVLAGHNHKFVDGHVINKNGNQVPVVQGGYNGRGLSRVRFTFDDENKLTSAEPYTHVFQGIEETLPVDKEIADKMKEWEDKLEPIFAVKVTDLPTGLDHDKNNGLSPLGVTVSEAMRKIGGTQIAIANGGGIRRPLYAGQVTVGDMYEILPFDNTLVTLKVKGSDLVKLIEHGINPDGFGWGQFSGLKVWYDESTDEITSIRLEDGTKIDMDEYYTVTTIDFLITGGDGYDFSNAIDVNNTQKVMRDDIQAEWEANGIPTLDYDLLVAGQDPTVDAPDVEDTPEEKPEVKPEDKPEVEAPEVNQPENPGEDNNEGSETNKPDELPETGAPISSAQLAMIGLSMVAIGAIIFKKKKVS